MGDYTGLRFTAQLTPFVAETFRSILEDEDILAEALGIWEYAQNRGIPIPQEFMAYSRKSMIPFGAVCYMPASWGYTKGLVSPEGVWDVVCSAKDYGYHKVSMMETFVLKVLPLLIQEPCRVEILFELWDTSQFYEVIPHETPRIDAVD